MFIAKKIASRTSRHLLNHLNIKASISTKVVCFCGLLKCSRSHFIKQCRPRSDYFCKSSPIWVHTVTLVYNVSKGIFRCILQVFLVILRVDWVNPFKPSILFMGHRQTAQNHTRLPDAAFCSVWSGSSLFASRMYFSNLNEMKFITQYPLNSTWNHSIDKGGKFH